MRLRQGEAACIRLGDACVLFYNPGYNPGVLKTR